MIAGDGTLRNRFDVAHQLGIPISRATCLDDLPAEEYNCWIAYYAIRNEDELGGS